jgi:hypothetical protein
MYEKGLLKIVTPPCKEHIEEGWCDEQWDVEDGGHGKHTISDSGQSGYPNYGAGTAYLPHRCDEWVIGGREQIKTLIEDLTAILEAEEIE